MGSRELKGVVGGHVMWMLSDILDYFLTVKKLQFKMLNSFCVISDYVIDYTKGIVNDNAAQLRIN